MKKNNVVALSSVVSHNLSREEMAEAINWRNEINPGFGLTMGETFCRSGLQKIIDEAAGIFCEKAVEFLDHNGSNWLPWNLAGAGAPWWSLPYRKTLAINGGVEDWVLEKHPENQFLKEYAEKFSAKGNIVEYAARFAGWLKAAGEMRGLVKVIWANTGNGMGSPYTTVNPFSLFEKWSSPHRAERQIWKVRRRANQILAPYGISVSWMALGQAVACHSKAVGKAAVWAANDTLGDYLLYYDNREDIIGHEEKIFYLKAARGLAEMKNYSSAVQRWVVSRVFDGEFQTLREALQSSSSRLVEHNTDGVRLFLDPATQQVIHRVEVTLGWGEEREGFGQSGTQFLLRQMGTNRTFHCRDYYGDSHYAVKQAISAWRKQAELERREADLVAFLRGDHGFCPLIYRQDSYRSGNCESGTESWISRHGWSDRNFVPAEWLIPYLGEIRVRNAVMILYQDLVGFRIAA